MIQLIGTIGLVACAVASSGFVVLYHLSARWWRTEEGWHLMTFTGALAVVFDWVTFRTLAVDPRPVGPAVGIVRAAIFIIIAVLLAWRVWLLYRRQIRPGLRRTERSKT